MEGLDLDAQPTNNMLAIKFPPACLTKLSLCDMTQQNNHMHNGFLLFMGNDETSFKNFSKMMKKTVIMAMHGDARVYMIKG